MLDLFLVGKLTLSAAIDLVGMKAAADVKKRVTAGAEIPPPNAPSTVAQKLLKGAWKRKERREASRAKAGKAVYPQTAKAEAAQWARDKAAAATGKVRTLIDSARMVGAVTWAAIMGQGSGAGEGTP